MSDWYILDEETHEPIETEMIEACEWLQDHPEFKTVDRTRIGLINKINVSTVFLGLDHRNLDDTDPVVFETMISGGEYGGYQRRYTTWNRAQAGHRRAVTLARG